MLCFSRLLSCFLNLQIYWYCLWYLILHVIFIYNIGNLYLFLLSCLKLKVKVAQSCLTLCNPMDYTVHGILQARILERVSVPFSRGSFQPIDQTQVSCIAGRFFTSWATKEAPECKVPVYLQEPSLWGTIWPCGYKRDGPSHAPGYRALDADSEVLNWNSKYYGLLGI